MANNPIGLRHYWPFGPRNRGLTECFGSRMEGGNPDADPKANILGLNTVLENQMQKDKVNLRWHQFCL